MIIKTNKFIPKRFSAYTIGPIILIRPEWAADKILLQHERCHVQQFWRYLGLNGLLYKFSKRWRLKFELEAHRVEYRLDPSRLDRLANNLASNYGLSLMISDARQMIEGK